jgi:hypothetical protein
MSVTTTSLSDSLPSSIPKLDASGLNWAIFSVRFQDAIEAKGFWEHFDGSGTRPSAVPVSVTGVDGVTTTTPLNDTQLAAIDKWDKDERSAKSLLTQKIPDSTLMRVHTKRTVQERWEAIVTEYTEKGAYAQTDLRGRFLESKCPDKGNVREFLDNLRVKREELASVGVDIDEKDYRSTIISSLPFALANFASSQLAAARMFAVTKTIAPDSLISLISEEYERQKTQKSRRSGKTKDDGDEAMAVGSSSGKGKGKPRYPHGVCWNCGKKGHYKDKCPDPVTTTGKTAAKDPKKEVVPSKSDSANTVESDSESEAAFLMTCDTDSVESDNLGDGDWFDEVAKLDFKEKDWFSDEEEDECFSSNDSLENPPLSDTSDVALVAAELASAENRRNTQTRAELYDSGCTKHISPYRDDLIDFIDIPPKSFRAANKQSFSATGTGKLIVDLPNSRGSSKLELTDVQYSPEVAYTLVSVGYLDDKGFTVKFGGGKCEITDPNGIVVGVVPKTNRGLYRVEHYPDSANVATEELTLDQFHRRMGHISHESARKLVSEGLVTGISLDLTGPVKTFFCESCIYAKSSRKPISKVREGERAVMTSAIRWRLQQSSQVLIQSW